MTTPAIIRSQGKFRTLIAEIGLAVPAFALIFKPPRRISRGLGTDRVRGGNIGTDRVVSNVGTDRTREGT